MNEKRQAYMKEYLKKYRLENVDVKITFSKKDFLVIKKIAEKQGLKPTTFIRNSAFAQARNIYLFPEEIEKEIKLAVRNMRGIGNNINQIAKYINESNFASPEYLESVFSYLQKLEAEIVGMKKILSDKKV